jgi:exosome complex component RRP4
VVDIKSPYDAILPVSEALPGYMERVDEISGYFDIGDIIFTKVKNVTKSKQITLTMKQRGLKKLREGQIIEIQPVKVPRVIGKKGTMISLIKDATGCDILVGQNGRIWLKGEPKEETRAIEAIRKIEAEAHISGLTDQIKKMLECKR